MEFRLREISPDDNVNKISLGNPAHRALKTFLKEDAKLFHTDNIAKTFVLVEKENPEHIKGFLTLGCSEIELDLSQRPNFDRRKIYKYYPCIKILRLAIDKKIQGQRIGTRLIKSSIHIVKNKIMPFVGCRYLSVNAKQDAIAFYQKVGFSMLEHEDNYKAENPLLFLDMNSLE